MKPQLEFEENTFFDEQNSMKAAFSSLIVGFAAATTMLQGTYRGTARQHGA